MAVHYRTLLINSTSRTDRAIGAVRDTNANEVAYDVHSVADLKSLLGALLRDRTTFDAAVFSTHGNGGVIAFNGDRLPWWKIYEVFYNDTLDYSRLFPRGNGRILFGGCNVAEGDLGWKFLLAASRSFLAYGGEAIGWTSVGLQAPFGLQDGHIVHLWGDTKQVRNVGGRFRFYVNWDLLEVGGVPAVPEAVVNAFR